MPKLIYLPLERYSNRYTEYLSGNDGMFAYGVRNSNVGLDIIAPDNELHRVCDGVVVDYVRRCEFAFAQVTELVRRIQAGSITNDSVIYIEDFWHPGMEMIPYACTLKGIRPKVYAFCHAQSADPNDFTVQMLPWIRSFEIGWASWLTGIFVAAEELKVMLVSGLEPITPVTEKIHVCGTVFAREVLMRKYYEGRMSARPRDPTVLFTSRPDKEKRPDIFFALAKKAFRAGDKWSFVALSGRSYPYKILEQASEAGVSVISNVDKTTYLRYLAFSSVMFNCADQDFIGYCQLDALAYGCAPLCPAHLSFPDLFVWRGVKSSIHLYRPHDVNDAYEKLQVLMEGMRTTCQLQLGNVPEIYGAYGQRFESSVHNMLRVMFQ